MMNCVVSQQSPAVRNVGLLADMFKLRTSVPCENNK